LKERSEAVILKGKDYVKLHDFKEVIFGRWL